MFSGEFGKISENTFSYRTAPVATSAHPGILQVQWFRDTVFQMKNLLQLLFWTFHRSNFFVIQIYMVFKKTNFRFDQQVSTVKNVLYLQRSKTF